MKRRFVLLLSVLLILTVVPAYAAPDVRAEKALESPGRTFDRGAHFRQMADLQERLNRSAIDLRDAQPLVVEVSRVELESVREANRREMKMRVGIVKELAVPVEFPRARFTPLRVTEHDTFGAVRADLDGSFEWAGAVRSPDAAALRVHFTDFDLPEGAELYVHSNGMAFGPYTGRGPNNDGDFWTNTIAGAEMVVQLRAGASGEPRFTIAGVGHLTGAFALAQNLRPVTHAGSTPCSYNASCVVDAACVATNSAVNTARNAVAHMLFVSGAYLYICSGGLIADSDTSTNVPYFLTANHCISRASEASSLETFFFYTASSCGSCPDPGAASTTGATIVSTNKTSDYTLMRLSQPAPAGAAFLGWSSTAVANTNGTPLFRLSHPQGAPQSYSTHVVDTSKGTCRTWPRGSWIYSTDTLGATEGGSSGSPVVNAAGQVVGQLSGGCGYNVNDVCDDTSNATVDGAFAAYYTAVAGILGSGGGGGGGGCTDADGDGYCVTQGDCNDNNASISPGANDTQGKNGRNGIDNDCDGLIDG
ncbi:MAG TPA: trypsin-like peptidase domain-containing protein [Thermoanaerobaculia bacterium]|jgi:V8-like Glu-specific endopeptidase